MTTHTVSEEIVRFAVEACPSGLIMTNAAGEMILVNAQIERQFGYQREELIGQSIEIIVPTPARPVHACHSADFVAHPEARHIGTNGDLYGLRKNGVRIPVEIDLNSIRTASGLMTLSVVTDITARKRAEATLHQYAEREQLLAAVVESSDDAIVTKTLDGTITSWNKAAERLFGFTTQEAVGKSIDIIVPVELRNEVRAILDHVRRDEKVNHYETVRTSKSGQRIDVSLSISPIKSSTGHIIGATKVARDITAQKRDQKALIKREEELQRSNADLEQFAYVASHDLQEPLRMVATFAELLAEHYKGALDEKAEKYIGYVVDGATRMQQLVMDLLAYARIDSQGSAPTWIKSDTLVKSVLENLKIAIEENHADIICDVLPTVHADEVQLAQVFQNLIGNALKFHGERPVHIRIGAERNDDKWTFRVADNGIGIDREYADLVFHMFQRLHERGRYNGDGIGLAIAKKIVERHGGRIWFTSELQKGSTFYFTMPAILGGIA